MKTPKEMANRIVDDLYDEVFTALAAERQRADALAEALRSIMFLDRDMSMGDIDDVWCNAYDIARAALAAYDAEAQS